MSKKKKVSKVKFLNAKITSTISITMVLVLLGMAILILFLGQGLSNFVKENMSFSVMLDSNVKEADITRIKTGLEAKPFVKSTRYISKEESKQKLIEELGEDPEELIGFNPAQDVIEIFLHSEYANNDSIALINKELKQENNVQDLIYQQEALDFVNNNISKATIILLILAAILLFISFTLIRNTIRLSIYSKRFIINTMKLVGATGGFIRRPFMRSNIVNGIFAGLLANGIIYFIISYFGKEYRELSTILPLSNMIIIFGIVIIFGILITTVATFFAVNRYVKMSADNLYYI